MATAADGADPTQAKRAGPDRRSRAEGVSRAERGNDGSPHGARRRRRLDAQHDSATGHASWPGTPIHPSSSNPILQASSSCCGRCPADPAQPVRLPLRGAKRSAAGIGCKPFPWRASAAPQARRHRHRAQQKKRCAPRGTTHRMLAPRNQFVAGDTIDCNCSITPGSTNTHGWLDAIGTLNTSANTSRFRWASRPVR